MGSEHAHAEIARELWTAFAVGDADRLIELFAPDAVWRSYGQNPLAGEVKGVLSVLERMAGIGEGVDELHSTLKDIYVSERGAVLRTVTHAERGPKVLDCGYLLELRIESGRVTEVEAVPMDQRRSDDFWRLE